MTYKLEQNRKRVLVVEDHEDTRFMLKLLLEHEGYAIMEVADGLEAVEIAGRERPDLVLMDGSLPGLDGLSATRRIRETESLRGVPIIALSGHVGADFRAEARAAGCDALLTKPIDLSQLMNTLNELLYPHSRAA
jgi:CheY-like chemotaxis protein